MNRKVACQILGVYPDISEKELKRTYRRLMNLTHPDSNVDSDYPYDAYDINEAYGYLISHPYTPVKKSSAKVNKPIK